MSSASMAWSAPKLDGEIPVPKAFKAELVMSFGSCNLGSDYHRGEGLIVFECKANTNTVLTCTVRNAPDGNAGIASTLTGSPKRAIKFDVATKDNKTLLTSAKQLIRDRGQQRNEVRRPLARSVDDVRAV
ncbi:MAG: hypothetical protein QM831_21495 [Kofleriaceae bacterium]